MNIAIVGNGVSSIMSAALISKQYPDIKITILKTKTVESYGELILSDQMFTTALDFLNIKRETFFSKTDSSISIGYNMFGFYNGLDDFFYPCGKPNISGTQNGILDWYIKKSKNKNLEYTDFVESYYISSYMNKYNTIPSTSSGSGFSFDYEKDSLFITNKDSFLKFIENNYLCSENIKIVESDITEVISKNDKIEKIVLSNKEEVVADLFIDCSGAVCALDNLNSNSYLEHSGISQNNSLISFYLNYKDKHKEIKNTVSYHATKNGWISVVHGWQGFEVSYSYSDKYISDEEAIQDLKSFVDSNYSIYSSDLYLDKNNIEIKKFKLKTSSTPWNKNVVKIAESHGYVNHIFSNTSFIMISSIFQIMKMIDRGVFTKWDIEVYNHAVSQSFKNVVDSVKLLYALSIREDSDYWLDIYNLNYDFGQYRDNWENSFIVAQQVKTKTSRLDIDHKIPIITCAMRYMLVDNVSIKIAEITNQISKTLDYEEMFNFLDIRKESWNSFIKQQKNTYIFLKEKYYDKENN